MNENNNLLPVFGNDILTDLRNSTKKQKALLLSFANRTCKDNYKLFKNAKYLFDIEGDDYRSVSLPHNGFDMQVGFDREELFGNIEYQAFFLSKELVMEPIIKFYIDDEHEVLLPYLYYNQLNGVRFEVLNKDNEMEFIAIARQLNNILWKFNERARFEKAIIEYAGTRTTAKIHVDPDYENYSVALREEREWEELEAYLD